ncbi:MAG: site-2 protease family protein [Candidatus Saccharibacteria bacterium]
MSIDILYLVIVLSIVLVSMTFHEAMHAFAAYWLGDDTARLHGRLSLNPIKHIDPFLTIILPIMLALSGGPIFGGAKPVPFNPNNLHYGDFGPAIVALAGPLTNLLLSFIIFGIWVVVGLPSQGIWGQIFVSAISVNLGFFIFNLIPIPPLDGSRVLYSLAPEFVRRGMESIERYGIIIVFMIIFFAGAAFSSFMIAIINFFITAFGHIYGL